MRRRNAGGSLDTTAARELELFVENDSQLYHSQEKPIQKNLITKMARGVYKHAGAVKLYGYLMESGAKKYVREYGDPGASWHEMFNTATRKHAAERFASSFETEAKLGNYDQLLPKKYAGWSGRGQSGNPTASLPRGKWVNAQVMVTSKGEIKAKIPQSAVKRNPYDDYQPPGYQQSWWAIYRKDSTKGYAWHLVDTGFLKKSDAQAALRRLKKPSDRQFHVYWQVHKDIGKMFG